MQATLSSNLSIVLSSTRMRLITISRYPGQIVLDILVPIVFATLPILLGRATAGDQAATVFAENTGTSNYAAYMLLGSCMFAIVSFAFWNMAYWLRWEQESGTLEALYLAPTRRVWVAAGIALYSCIRSVVSALLAYFIGARLLNASPIQGQTVVALLFITIGLIPLYGLTLLFGAVILKVKEANSLVGLMQWGVSFLMGVFFPVAFFPPVLKALALLFPPTWMANGVRAALLGTSYFLEYWYMDLAVLWAFLFIAPAFGYWVFMRAETSVRRHEGVGQF